MVVGDGKTSVRRCGGPFWGSLFQMVLPQGNDVLVAWPRPIVDPVVELTPLPQGIWSLEGAVELGLAGENGPLPPREPLRVGCCCVSVSQDGRRVGFGPGLLVTGCKRCRWSCSSSEEASASESGVDPRMPAFDLSIKIDALPPEKLLNDVRFA